MAYDHNNIFAKILRSEIPNDTVYEDEYVLAFRDIQPHQPVHVIVIPKGEYISFQDFSTQASDAEIGAFVRAVAKIAKDLGIDETGYRLLSNHGKDSNQEVPHFHLHLCGGANLGALF